MHRLIHALDQGIRSAEFLEGRRAAPEVLGRRGRPCRRCPASISPEPHSDRSSEPPECTTALSADTIQVRAVLTERAVSISVHDPGLSGDTPHLQDTHVMQADGRGLRIVQRLARRWGFELDHGHRVWAELPTATANDLHHTQRFCPGTRPKTHRAPEGALQATGAA
jgi:hypothetical protein